MADHPPADGIGEVAVRAPQQRLDPAHQLAQPERLGQVVVGTELEADDLVDLVIARGQDQDRHLGPGRAHAAEDLEAVDAREPDVEHDEVRRLVRGDVEALLARAGDGHVVALLLEGVLDAPRDGVLVFDDEDGGGHRGDATPMRGIRRFEPLARPWYPTARSLRAPHHGRPGRRAAARSDQTNQPTFLRSASMSTAPARPKLAAEPREITGKAVKRLRQEGRLPGVVYGHGAESSNISLDSHEFDQLRRAVGSNALVDLSVDGAKAQPVLVHGVQIHPVKAIRTRTSRQGRKPSKLTLMLSRYRIARCDTSTPGRTRCPCPLPPSPPDAPSGTPATALIGRPSALRAAGLIRAWDGPSLLIATSFATGPRCREGETASRE